MELQKELYTFKESAEILGVSHSTVKRWASEGKISVKHITSKTVRLTKEELEKLVENGVK